MTRLSEVERFIVERMTAPAYSTRRFLDHIPPSIGTGDTPGGCQASPMLFSLSAVVCRSCHINGIDINDHSPHRIIFLPPAFRDNRSKRW